MISVQNLLQQLSGSKKIFLWAIVAAFILSSCETTRGIRTSDTSQKTEPKKVLTPSTNKPNNTKPNQTASGESNKPTVPSQDKPTVPSQDKPTVPSQDKPTVPKQEKPAVVAKPDTIIQIVSPTNGGILNDYNVVVLLPFNAQKNSQDSQKIDPKSEVALEFYQGMLLALRELKSKGMNFTLRVYDTRVDQFRTKSLLNSLEYERIDLIIGPVYNKCLQEAAEWARLHQTYLISPIASNADFIQENPYFIALNPTTDAHFSKLAQFITSNQRADKVTIITDGNSQKDTKLAQDIEQKMRNLGGFNNNLSVNVIYDTPESKTKFQDYLTQGVDNHVIVACMDEVIASEIVRRLQMVHSQYPIVLYGMPNWTRFDEINIDYLENMNLHLTSSSSDDSKDAAQQQMINNYKAAVGLKPSEFSKKGYDLSYYLFETMHKNGSNLGVSLPQTGKKNGKFMDFNVQAIRSYSGGTRFFENTAVKMLKFENFEFKVAD